MKRSHSAFAIDFCHTFGQILSFGQLTADETKLNRDLQQNFHFLNTLDTTDPICADKETLAFRKKFQPELYSKGQKAIQDQIAEIHPQQEPIILRKTFFKSKSVKPTRFLNLGSKKDRKSDYTMQEALIVEYRHPDQKHNEYERIQQKKRFKLQQQLLQRSVILSAQDIKLRKEIKIKEKIDKEHKELELRMRYETKMT